MRKKTLISVCGPTASGKTALGIKIAQAFNTEIISADSRQFYREMEVGTAKPSADELATVQHHFINSHSVNDYFSVADFENEALRRIEKLFQQQHVVVMVGGSGLYLQAIYQGFDDLPAVQPAIRQKWNLLFEEFGIAKLQTELKLADPVYYNKIDLNNPQRIIRALEVSDSSGKPFSSYLSGKKSIRDFEIIKIGIDLPRDILYRQINTRVDQMLEKGLVKEVCQLQPYRYLNALNTVGYKEIFEMLTDNLPIEKVIQSIKQNTRRFAKRQMTWFRKDPEINWFGTAEPEPILQFLQEKLKSIKRIVQ